MTLYIPLILEVVEKIGRAAFLSKIDLNKEFHQVKMARSDLEKTAIVTPFGKFEFSRIPFGLCNATSTFQRLMDGVLEGVEFASAYIDDTLIYSESFQSHLEHIQRVMERLEKVGLINASGVVRNWSIWGILLDGCAGG